MSYFVLKIGHLDPRFYSLIYCAIPGVQMSGVQMSDFISKIGHLDPRFYSVIYCAIPGVQMSGVQMSGVQMSGVQMSGVQMYPTHTSLSRRGSKEDVPSQVYSIYPANAAVSGVQRGLRCLHAMSTSSGGTKGRAQIIWKDFRTSNPTTWYSGELGELPKVK